MKRLVLIPLAMLVAAIGSAQAGPRATDPIVADWKAKETCRHGGCSAVYGSVRVTAAGADTFTAAVTEKLWLLGDPACVHQPGQQVWQLKRVAAGKYQGTSDVFTSDSSPGWNCQHSPFAATWTLTGRNKLTLDSSAYGGIAHTFTRNPLVDETPPTLTVGSVSGERGETLRLPFTVKDDSGRATVSFLVYQGRKIVGRGGQLRSAKGEQQAFSWTAPEWVGRSLRLCMTAKDATGNECAQLCKPVSLR